MLEARIWLCRIVGWALQTRSARLLAQIELEAVTLTRLRNSPRKAETRATSCDLSPDYLTTAVTFDINKPAFISNSARLKSFVHYVLKI